MEQSNLIRNSKNVLVSEFVTSIANKKWNQNVTKLPKVTDKASQILGIIQPKNDLVEVNTKAAQVLGIPEGLSEQLQPPPSTKKEKKAKSFKTFEDKTKNLSKPMKRALDPDEVRNLNEKAQQILGIAYATSFFYSTLRMKRVVNFYTLGCYFIPLM
jgi:transcriptional regulator of acetoin/glycerol metabolism